MAEKELDVITQSLEALLEEQEAAHEADLSAEERLYALKEKNILRLALLSAAQREEAYKQIELLEQKALEEDSKRAQKKLDELEEYYARMAELSEEEFQREFNETKKQAEEKLKAAKKAADKAKKKEDNKEKEGKKTKKKTKKEVEKEGAEKAKQLLSRGTGGQQLMTAFKLGAQTEGGAGAKLSATMANLSNVLGNMIKQLDNTITSIGSKKSAIDTRLYGTGKDWDGMTKRIMSIAAASPLIKQSDIANKIDSMVKQGIAFNVEQRAVLDVMKDKIATTFEATNSTLLRLVRIQQQDTTASRLGMEAALNEFLNSMYATTEYMSKLAENVKGSLEEAMSLMSGENALSFEYQVQKWLGSMYSVGMSDQAVQGLGGILGKIAAGQLEGITGGGQGNLVIMAANQAGLSVADILNNGLNAKTTNELLNSMVDYLAKLYKEAGDSKVIQQQMAQVYGMTASDLAAMTSLARLRQAVSRNGLTYASAMSKLSGMAGSMASRTSSGEFLENIWENLKYTMSAGIASNPVLYGIYKAANMLSDLTGGIDIGLPLVMGNGLNASINIANLMRVAALSGGILGNIGNIASGIGNAFGGGTAMLRAIGALDKSKSYVTRGSGAGLTTSGVSVSESGSYVGNSSGSDVQNATFTTATDEANATTANAVDANEDKKLSDVYSEVVDIYHLLQEIATGAYTIPVDVKNSELKVSSDSGF